MSRLSNRVSYMAGRRREVATLVDVDPAMGIALLRDDCGYEMIVGLEQIEQWNRMVSDSQEKYGLMMAYERDRQAEAEGRENLHGICD